MTEKAKGAFLTIGELADELALPQHILRYWETRFPQLRPLQRAGKRRYYRPEDVVLAKRINALLNQEGYTIKGVQKLLSAREEKAQPALQIPDEVAPAPSSDAQPNNIPELKRVRAALAEALALA